MKEWLALDDTDQDQQAKDEHLARYRYVVPEAKGRKVMDVGCGAGYGAAAMAELAEYVVGVDRRPEAIAYAREHYKRENLAFNETPIRHLTKVAQLSEELGILAPWFDPKFDLVTSFEVLEHLEDPEDLLLAVRALLSPRGTFYLSTPFYDREVHVAPADAMANFGNPWHLHAWDEPGLRRLLSPHFRDVRVGVQHRLEFYLYSRGPGTSWFVRCTEPVP